MKRINVTSNQLALLVAGSGLMFPYSTMPIVKAPPGNQDIWIVGFFALACAVLFNTPFLYVSSKFRGLDVNQMNDLFLGKVAGRVLSFILGVFCLYILFASEMFTIIFISNFLLEETPFIILVIITIAPTTYILFKGVGVLCRSGSFFVGFILLTIIMFFFLGLNKMEFDEVLPILSDTRPGEFWKGAFYTIGHYPDIFLFFVLTFFMNKKHSISVTYFKAFGIFAFGLLLMLMPIIFVVGVNLAKLSNNPYLLYSRQVGGIDFIQRVQSINTLAWFTGTIIKNSLYSYSACYFFSGAFKVNYKKLIVPVMSIISIITLLVATKINRFKTNKEFPYINIFFIYILPVIMLIIYKLQKKRILTDLADIKKRIN